MFSAKTAWLLAILAGLWPVLAAAQTPASVRVTPLREVLVEPEISAPATVVSLGDSRIGAELNARIREIPVRVGDIVQPGHILARLDCTDYELATAELQARVDGVEAQIEFAGQQLRRAETLKKQSTVSQELLDERQSNMAMLKAERDANRATLAKARHDLGKCIVRSPFQAVVMERLASVGEYAMPGTALLRVLDIGHLEISAAIGLDDAPQLQIADAPAFRQNGKDYPVQLRVLTPAIDTLGRTREARLLFTGESALPGASGRLIWRMPQAVPADLLVRRAGVLGLLLAQDQQARFHPLPLAQEGRPAVVDLSPDVLVITDGRFALNDGDAIVITE
ncbi:MAG: efflux RND transporter periplasmic adaptor subunit [Gammaproteobacteria bacterium]|nr:efflux RND transporter periplasmic adaptor subunit [Gammaproteobacteria bacterium]